MTDIEVGSLCKDPNGNTFKILGCGFWDVYLSDDKVPEYVHYKISLSDFRKYYKVIPKPQKKEYKVWVYETPDGDVMAWREQNDSIRWTLKAILTGKEGDGL